MSKAILAATIAIFSIQAALAQSPANYGTGGTNQFDQNSASSSENSQVGEPRRALTGGVNRSDWQLNGRTQTSVPIRGGVGLGGENRGFPSGAGINTGPAPANPKFWLQATHPEFDLAVHNDPAQILEVEGTADSTAPLLRDMAIPFERIKPDQLRDSLSSRTKVLVVDCAGTPGEGVSQVLREFGVGKLLHIGQPLPKEDWELVRQWVGNGGFLLTNCFTLPNLVGHAFPGTIAWDGSELNQYMPPRTRAVVSAPDPALLAGTYGLSDSWSLSGCLGLRILRPDQVRVLVSTQYGKPLACEFAFGRGSVLHLVGHYTMSPYRFGLPLSEHMEFKNALFANFIIQGLEHASNGG